MKILHFLLSAYLLLLAVEPCCVDAECGPASGTHGDTHQSAGDSDQFGCSPFCVACSVCGFSVVPAFLAPLSRSISCQPLDPAAPPKGPAIAIWHPPKIG